MTNQPQNQPQLSVAEISKLRQEQSLVAGLEMYHSQLVQRAEAYSRQSGLGNAHRALLYIQGNEYGDVLNSVRGMPSAFKPAADAFVQKVEEIHTQLNSQLGNKQDLRKSISEKLALELIINQHNQSTQLFIPIKSSEKSQYDVLQQLYRHCKEQLVFRQGVQAGEEEFHSYIVLSAPKALSKESLRERLTKDLPEAVTQANIELAVADDFCFPYHATAQPAKQALAALAQPPKPDGKPKAEAMESKAKPEAAAYQKKYSPELMKEVYVLRDQGKTCVEIAPIVGKSHGLKLSTGNIAAILAWRNRSRKRK